MIIGIRSAPHWTKELKRGLKRGLSGQLVESRESVYFESAALRNFFSDRRLESLRAVREQRPRSIKELAQLVGRDSKNVNAEVHGLARLGFIELETERGPGAKGRKRRKARFSFESPFHPFLRVLRIFAATWPLRVCRTWIVTRFRRRVSVRSCPLPR